MNLKHILIQFIISLSFAHSAQCFEKSFELNPQSESPLKSKLDNFYDVIANYYDQNPTLISPTTTFDYNSQPDVNLQNSPQTSHKRKREDDQSSPRKVRRILEYGDNELMPAMPYDHSQNSNIQQTFEYFTPTMPASIEETSTPISYAPYLSTFANTITNSTDYSMYLNRTLSAEDNSLLTTYTQPTPVKIIQEHDIALPAVGDNNNKNYIDQLIEIRKKNHPKICCSQKHLSWPTFLEHIKSKHASICGFSCPETGCNQHRNSRPNLLAEMYATHAHKDFLSCPRCKKEQSAGNLKNHFLKCSTLNNEVTQQKPKTTMYQSFKVYKPK
ncbi:hypothetical protein Noda2021_01400 [Candidatus Dependentiae bacterium Noda2021]|nr:hypothetical protein Noda2021_01400 [Candidatus Dependentiae bacterium Noda2021]